MTDKKPTNPVEEKTPAKGATAPTPTRPDFTEMDLRPGAVIRVSQKIVEGEKERVQVFEGMIIAKRGSRKEHRTITVRKVSNGVGVERILPLAMPSIVNIKVLRLAHVRRAKLHYLRNPRARKPKETVVSSSK